MLFIGFCLEIFMFFNRVANWCRGLLGYEVKAFNVALCLVIFVFCEVFEGEFCEVFAGV